MSSTVSEVVKQLLEGMHTISKSETIIGEPLRTKDSVVIPVHRLRLAFATGTAKADAHATSRGGRSGGHGAGGTVQLDPVAVIAVGPDGTPRILAVDGDAEGGVQRLIDQLPDLALKAAKVIGERIALPVLGDQGPKLR